MWRNRARRKQSGVARLSWGEVSVSDGVFCHGSLRWTNEDCHPVSATDKRAMVAPLLESEPLIIGELLHRTRFLESDLRMRGNVVRQSKEFSVHQLLCTGNHLLASWIRRLGKLL